MILNPAGVTVTVNAGAAALGGGGDRSFTKKKDSANSVTATSMLTFLGPSCKYSIHALS